MYLFYMYICIKTVSYFIILFINLVCAANICFNNLTCFLILSVIFVSIVFSIEVVLVCIQ